MALVCAGFITILTEAMPAGLLPQIGEVLGVSPDLDLRARPQHSLHPHRPAAGACRDHRRGATGVWPGGTIWLAGLLIDRWLRALLLIICALFGLIAVALAFWINIPAVIYVAIALWGLAFGGLPALLQTALAKSAGASADAAQSMLVTVWNLGIAGGGLAGGVLLEGWGGAAFPWAVALLRLLALAGASQAAPQQLTRPSLNVER